MTVESHCVPNFDSPSEEVEVTVLSEILAARVFGSSKIPEKKRIQKMLDLVANARRSLDIL
jgi:hypothetical protein